MPRSCGPGMRPRPTSSFAGNTAAALAWYARRFGVSCRSILPDYAPDVKVRALRDEFFIKLVFMGRHDPGPILELIEKQKALYLKQMNRLKKAEPPKEPTTRDCPKCCSAIPVKATRCPNCTSELAAG